VERATCIYPFRGEEIPTLNIPNVKERPCGDGNDWLKLSSKLEKSLSYCLFKGGIKPFMRTIFPTLF
jgi:hypothetical protein